MDASLLKCEPFTEAESAMIISTRIRVGRNLEAKPFGAGYKNKDQRLEIETSVKDVLQKFDKTHPELAGEYHPLTGMDEGTKKQLIDDHFLFKEADKYLEAIGLNDDWPSGRGIFHNKDKTFLTWINEED